MEPGGGGGGGGEKVISSPIEPIGTAPPGKLCVKVGPILTIPGVMGVPPVPSNEACAEASACAVASVGKLSRLSARALSPTIGARRAANAPAAHDASSLERSEERMRRLDLAANSANSGILGNSRLSPLQFFGARR